MARIFVLSGSSIGATFDLDGTAVIGRGKDADIMVVEKSMSRIHARLVPQREAGAWKVMDLDSSNGLHTGGRRVRDAILRDGDTFILGDIEFRLRDDPEEADATTPAEIETPPVEVPEDEANSGPGAAGKPDPVEDLDLGDELFLEEAPELDFGDALPEAKPKPKPGPARRSATEPAAAPAAKPSDTSAKRAERRVQAMGGAGAPAAPAGTGAGRPVLQYATGRQTGRDLGQLPGWMRVGAVLLGLGLAFGIAYAAFTLTRTARSQSEILDSADELPE